MPFVKIQDYYYRFIRSSQSDNGVNNVAFIEKWLVLDGKFIFLQSNQFKDYKKSAPRYFVVVKDKPLLLCFDPQKQRSWIFNLNDVKSNVHPIQICSPISTELQYLVNASSLFLQQKYEIFKTNVEPSVVVFGYGRGNEIQLNTKAYHEVKHTLNYYKDKFIHIRDPVQMVDYKLIEGRERKLIDGRERKLGFYYLVQCTDTNQDNLSFLYCKVNSRLNKTVVYDNWMIHFGDSSCLSIYNLCDYSWVLDHHLPSQIPCHLIMHQINIISLISICSNSNNVIPSDIYRLIEEFSGNDWNFMLIISPYYCWQESKEYITTTPHSIPMTEIIAEIMG